jgi:hypothetical protein
MGQRKPSESPEWSSIVLPAVKVLGATEIADRLRLNSSTVKYWLSEKKYLDNTERVKRAAVALANELGLFSDDELAKRNDASILTLVPARVPRPRAGW